MSQINSTFEGDIVKYYEAFFLPEKEKVKNECAYIRNLFRSNGVQKGTLIDAGCGTGIYSQALGGYYDSVLGIDISRDMISYAKKNHAAGNVSYELADITNGRLFGKYDMALSLAHVIGYQISDNSVESFLETIYKNLRSGGLFAFNFYNAKAFYSGILEPRSLKTRTGDYEITRISNAVNNVVENCLNLSYYYIIDDNKGARIDEIHEKMRYFTQTEILLFLKHCSFTPLCFFDWGTYHELSADNWNAGCLARKD